MTLAAITSNALTQFLVLALILFVVWIVISKMAPAISWIVGLIFAIILLIRALPMFGVSFP